MISSASRSSVKIGPRVSVKLDVWKLNRFAPMISRRHQVRGELDAPEVETDRLREAVREQCLGGPRRSFEQNVSASEERHQHQLDAGVLADDRLGNLVSDRLSELLNFVDFHRWTSSSH